MEWRFYVCFKPIQTDNYRRIIDKLYIVYYHITHSTVKPLPYEQENANHLVFHIFQLFKTKMKDTEMLFAKLILIVYTMTFRAMIYCTMIFRWVSLSRRKINTVSDSLPQNLVSLCLVCFRQVSLQAIVSLGFEWFRFLSILFLNYLQVPLFEFTYFFLLYCY